MLDQIDISLLSQNEIAREGLRRILISEEFHVRNSAVSAESFVPVEGTGRAERPHIIILDDPQDPRESCRDLSERFPHAHLVVLAEDFDLEEVALAFGCGIDGYIVKEISCAPLIESLKLVALGEKVLPSQLAHNLGSVYHATPIIADGHEGRLVSDLSAREIEILKCLMHGLPNKVACRQLNISEATVKVHVKAILRKLRVANRTQAAIWAVKHGFDRTNEPVEEVPLSLDA